MTLLHFQELGLKRALAELPASRITAFAASCAHRLACDVSQLEPSSEYDRILTEATSGLWQALRSHQTFDGGSLEARLIEIIPDEVNDEEFTAAVVEDAIASMIYAIRSIYSDRAQNAAWSARRVYETADRYSSQFLNDFEFSESSEIQILRHPVVQRELSRQARDLALLQSERSDADVLSDLQTRVSFERVLEETKTV